MNIDITNAYRCVSAPNIAGPYAVRNYDCHAENVTKAACRAFIHGEQVILSQGIQHRAAEWLRKTYALHLYDKYGIFFLFYLPPFVLVMLKLFHSHRHYLSFLLEPGHSADSLLSVCVGSQFRVAPLKEFTIFYEKLWTVLPYTDDSV